MMLCIRQWKCLSVCCLLVLNVGCGSGAVSAPATVAATTGTPTRAAGGMSVPTTGVAQPTRSVTGGTTPAGAAATNPGSPAPTTLVSELRDNKQIAVDESYIYWSVVSSATPKNGAIMRVEKNGGTPTAVVSGLGIPLELTLDATSLYWIEGAAIQKVAKQGGTSVVLVKLNEFANITALAVDDTQLYWTNYSALGSVQKMDKAGGSTPKTLAANEALPSSLALDEKYVYYSKEDGTNMAVMKVDNNGGTPVTLAAQQRFPASVVVDDKFVYWINPKDVDKADGKILKTAK